VTRFPDFQEFFDHFMKRLAARFLFALTVLLCCRNTGGFAQDAQLGPIVVTEDEIPPSQSILPGQKQIPSALGLDIPVMDTPRSVTVLSKAQLDDANIQSPIDLSRIVSDLYTYHVNGSPGTPLIRGQFADVVINGFRVGMTSDGVGTPFDFSSVESVDVFRGPATAVYGASKYVGGFINLNTKRPWFDAMHGSVSATVGMFDQYRWTADIGGPLCGDKLAFRLSYSGEESGSFYDYVHNQVQSIYTILTYRPTDQYRVDLLNSFYVSDYSYNDGINRPTQQLIDNGLYQTGTQQYQNFTNLPVSSTNPVSNLTPSTVPGQFGVVVPGRLVKIDRSRDLVNPSDSSYAKTDLAQVIQTLQITSDFQILNTSSFYYLDRRQFAALRYSAVVKGSYEIENRLEFHLNYDQPVSAQHLAVPLLDKNGKAVTVTGEEDGIFFKHQLNVGLDFKYQHVYSATDFNHEISNPYDLTADPSTILFPFSQVISGVNPSYRVPGTTFYASTGGTYVDANGNVINSGNGETNDSDLFDYAIYLEDRIEFSKQWSLFVGARGDLLALHFVDPVHPPGFKPVADSTVVGMYNVNASLAFRPVPPVTTYFTYDRTESENQGQGGGVSVDSNNRINAFDYHRISELYEVGAKLSLLHDKLFIGLAGFEQTRNVPQQGGTPLTADVWGAEADLNYQPNKNFWISLSYSYLNSWITNQSPFQQTGNVNDAFIPPTGTGLGSPNFAPLPTKDYRQPDIPQHILSARMMYQTDYGIGASLGLFLTSPQNLTWDGSVRIPTQYTLDAAIFYKRKNYELRIDFYNITDQKNFTPIADFAGADNVYADLPFRVEGTVRVTF
jgi:outer membrane receptor protein involved in Fe transport